MARILVIDDSPTVATFLEGALGRDGHEVAALDSFVDLYARLRDFEPDLVFLDLEMPALSGEKVGEFLRRFERRRVEIVLFSSRPRAEIDEVAAKLGAVAAIEKTNNPKVVRAAVRQLLAARAAEGRSAGAPARASSGIGSGPAR